MNEQYSDSSFLSKIIELFNLIYSDDPVILIGIDGIILFVGEKIQDITGISADDLLGKNHLEVLPLPKDNIDSILTAIDDVLKYKEQSEFLSVNLNHEIGYAILHCVLKPIINPSTHNVVALHVESKKLPLHIYLNSILSQISAKSYSDKCNQMNKDDLLTLREHEIAFLLFYFKSAKKVSVILSEIYGKSVSAKTIANIISFQLYSKFDVYGQEALLDKIYELGYHQKIPQSFLSNLFIKLS